MRLPLPETWGKRAFCILEDTGWEQGHKNRGNRRKRRLRWRKNQGCMGGPSLVALTTAHRHISAHGVLAVPLTAVLRGLKIVGPRLQARDVRFDKERGQRQPHNAYEPQRLSFAIRHHTSGPVY
jgi:hypothetical protein